MPETDLIFENIALKGEQGRREGAKRISIDCKATVSLGESSRGGKTRGDNRASDHDMGIKEKYIPCGIVDEDTGELFIGFGTSYKTSDFIVDTLQTWWAQLTPQQQKSIPLLQIKVDNGPESSGVRTQFLNRMVQWVERIGVPVQLLYYPPYHSKYNPIERCWGILEQHWNGALLTDVQTMLAWAQSMTWKGLHPLIKLNRSIYEKGISLTKKQMRHIEERLERNPLLPKYDVLIHPA
ncbi:MAG: transposase [Elainellaceae cyanobacterium]